MSNKQAEVTKRRAAAKAAIREAADDESSVGMFVSHHLDELDAAYWKKHCGSAKPTSSKVIDVLELRSHWGEDDQEGLDVFDFTLPGDVTNYVISVRFDEAGEVESIDMES